MVATDILTIGTLIGTIVLIVYRPGGLNEGVAAGLGAGVVLLLGTAHLADAWNGTVATAGVLAFLIAMMVVATVAEESGCFEWAAERALRLSRGNTRALFLNLYLLGALVTVFLSLDVTAIMVAPVVCALIRRVRLEPVPFVLASAYVANTASLFLPVSNLTNMLVYSLLAVPFGAFVRLMLLPNLAAMLVNIVVFLILFREDLPRRFELPVRATLSSDDDKQMRLAAIGLGLVILGLTVFGALGWPLFVPAIAGAIGLGTVSVVRGDVSAQRLLDSVAWSLPLFVIGMYTILVAASNAGLGTLWQSFFIDGNGSPSLLALVRVSLGTALGANLVNNLPAALVIITSIASAPQVSRLPIAFAGLIGTNIGANVTVFASLATMLVLTAARRYGYTISAGQFFRVGVITVPLMTIVATCVLWLMIR